MLKHLILTFLKTIKYYIIDLILYFKKLIGIDHTILTLDSGEFLRIRNIDMIGISLLKGQQFESVTREAIMSRVHDGMTVLDIGANIGYYTVQMAHKVGDKGNIIAFEPNPVMMAELQSSVRLNKFTNVITEQVALSDSKGTAEFCIPETGKESHGSLKQNITFTTRNQFNVQTDRLDDVLRRLNISKVDFIKIDVEGAEMLVFNGASNLLSGQYKPCIIFESAEHLCKPFGFRVFDVLSYLNAYGYSIEQFEYGMWLAQPIK